MRIALWPAAAALLALAGCSQESASNNTAANASVEANGSATATPSATIAEGLQNAGSSRFLAALDAAGLTKTLAAPGDYTVLVPSDEAFAKLPAGKLDALMQPSGREELTKILTYHVLPGTILIADADRAIANGKGKAVLATMNGGTVTLSREGDRLLVADSSGKQAAVSGGEERYKNGVVHSIDAVLIPG